MSVPRKINVVFIYVADLERARRFYEGTVGFGAPVIETAEWVEYAPAEGAHFALHLSSPEALDGCDRTRNTIGFSLVVDDLRARHEAMRAEGVEFTRPPEQAHGFELAEFRDPEGNPIRLIQPVASESRA